MQHYAITKFGDTTPAIGREVVEYLHTVPEFRVLLEAGDLARVRGESAAIYTDGQWASEDQDLWKHHLPRITALEFYQLHIINYCWWEDEKI